MSARNGRAEDFRAPAGYSAITVDFTGHTPTSFAIETIKLTDAVRSLDAVAANKTYAEVLSLFGAAFRRLKAGHNDATNTACLMAWWLAFRHPAGGPPMTDAISDMMARGERVHVTLHIGAGGSGATIALSDRFVDLDQVARRAKAQKLGVAVFERASDRVREPRQ